MKSFWDEYGPTELLFGLTATVLVGAVIAGIVFAVIAFGGDGTSNCYGTVSKLYTHDNPDTGIVVGGSSSGGGVVVPIDGGTSYKAALRQEDGTYCERSFKKATWLALEVGDVVALDPDGKHLLITRPTG